MRGLAGYKKTDAEPQSAQFTVIDTSAKKMESATDAHAMKEKPTEPDWFCGDLNGYPVPPQPKPSPGAAIQQDDVFKPLFLDIGNFGLNYVYHKYLDKDSEKYKNTKTEHPRKVLVVGAGMSGLVAGYELAKAGHTVTILEQQHRVGGRVKTLSHGHFYKGLWADSGAMRLPGKGLPDWKGPSHYLTDFYAKEFDLPVIPFVNQDDNGWLSFYDQPPIQILEWNKDPGKYCSHFWPGWDKNLNEDLKKKYNIKDINTYYNAVTQPVMDQLCKDPTPSEWYTWVMKWSEFSILSFLRTSLDLIMKMEHFSIAVDESELAPLKDLLPWPEEAITAYKKYNYTPQLDTSLVENLREVLGEWWKDPMHTFEEGLEMLPWAFVEKRRDVNLSECIQFGVTVHTLKYGPEYVQALCFNETTRETLEFEADAVIVTLPLNITRQLKFNPPIPPNLSDAIEGVFYSPSTKIMLQCKTRFWEESGIIGGFSRTDMPIGQIHYPSHPKPVDERGILLCYTWKQEALLFGSQSEDNAISEAVSEVGSIHPEIHKQFECGAVQAWYNDNSAQGAFCYMKPYEYNNSMQLLLKPHKNIFLAGEAISWANGWIQGAIGSGLRACYQFYAENENLFRLMNVN